jgi:heme A synthase
MQKVLLSVVVATVVIPLLAARDRSPRRGAMRLLASLLVFAIAYAAWVAIVHAGWGLPPGAGEGVPGVGP